VETSPSDGGDVFESILISPLNTGTPAPLVVYPHGGPHSHFGTGYEWTFAYFAVLGYHVQLINYRGSIGFGQAPLETLCGKCGFQDVKDCYDALEQVAQFVRF
jgi:dipeptidyl aminopeptidase/acylaminoacyl peptidase